MEFILLEICEKYGMSPLELDKIPDEIKISMIAKHRLDVEYKSRVRESE